MVNISDLRFSYSGKELIHMDQWSLAQGSHCLFLGNSGSGKTTLLHLIAGLLKPVSGNIVVAGTNITQLSASALDQFRGKNIGIIFQRAHLIASLSVIENLVLAQYLSGSKQNFNRAREVLADLNLEHKQHQKVYNLSQGEAQRVTIARAMMNDPKILLADEPTSALDDANCEKVITLIQDQAKGCNATLIISTHDQRLKEKFENKLKIGALS